MKNKYLFVTVLLAVILAAVILVSVLCARHQDAPDRSADLAVVTSCYPMYIAAENVIGDVDGVSLSNLTEPQAGCVHDYQLTTEDMRLIATADVLVINGGGLESFIEDIAAQYPALPVIDAGAGIATVDDNAHVWMSVAAYTQQVETIRDGLTAVDAAHAADYRANTDAYLSELDTLAAEEETLAGELAGQPVVLLHEAYEYLARDLGLNVVGVLDLDEERQVSAGEVADILRTLTAQPEAAVFVEETYGDSMAARLSEETDAQILYLDPLVRGDTLDADAYLTGMKENLTLISHAF